MTVDTQEGSSLFCPLVSLLGCHCSSALWVYCLALQYYFDGRKGRTPWCGTLGCGVSKPWALSPAEEVLSGQDIVFHICKMVIILLAGS